MQLFASSIYLYVDAVHAKVDVSFPTHTLRPPMRTGTPVSVALDIVVHLSMTDLLVGVPLIRL